MSKMKTVLVVFVALLLADNAFAQLRRPRRSMAPPKNTAAQEKGQSGIPGVTAPFIPFDGKNKIKFDDAVERAKNNDAEAFYWLSYYFAKGECVDQDGDSARKFLEKAVDANAPVACYTFGLFLENSVLQNEDGRGVGDRETQRGFENLHFIRRLLGHAAWHSPVSWNGNKCLTNKVAIAHIESFYQKAIDGGLSYATNDIARLHRKVAECERRIIQKKIDQEKKKIDQETRITNAEKAKALIRDSKEEYLQEYWPSWPTSVDDNTLQQLISDVEKKFNCTFIPYIMTHRWIIRPTGQIPAPIPYSTNTWFRTSGKSLVVNNINETFQKIDPDGRIVAWGLSKNRTDLEEFKYFESEKEKRLAQPRSDWAKERGMTLEEAMQKYKVWQEQNRMSLPPQPNRLLNLNNRPGLNAPSPNSRPPSGLEIARARRQARLAKEMERREAEEKRQEAEQTQKEREREKREREQAAEERKAQLEQLMQIQEELRLQREEKIRREQENGRP